MRVSAYLASSLAIAAISAPASAQSVTVVSYILGFRCMALNLTPQQMMDSTVNVPVRGAASISASQIGTAAPTVAAHDPLVFVNGFTQILFPTGREGWVESKLLKSWQPATGTNGKCLPAKLSNGRLGFDYK